MISFITFCSMTITYPNRIYASSIDANGMLFCVDFHFTTVEVGAKCMCDVCHLDISNLIYINCAECANVDLCISCFSSGSIPTPTLSDKLPHDQQTSSVSQHQATHAYYIKVALVFSS